MILTSKSVHLTAAFFLTLLSFSGHTARAYEDAAVRPLKVAWTRVSQADSFQYRRELTGVVEAKRSSAVGFEIGGALSAIYFDEGELVEAGTLLAKLDTARLNAQKAELQASYVQVTSEVNLAKETLNRVREAAELEAVSAQSYDEARYGLQSLENRLLTIQASIDRVDVELRKAQLYAPYKAVILKRMLDEGAVVSPGVPLFQLQEFGSYEIRVGIPKDVPLPSSGNADDWQARVDRGDLAIQFKALLPLRDPVTRTVPAIFTTETTENIRPGDQVTFVIWASEGKPGFWIPQTALAESDRGLWAVYAIVEQAGDLRIQRREVELLHLDGSKVFVAGALKDNDRLVWAGIHRLVPNQMVALGEEQFQERPGKPKEVGQ